MENDKKTIPNNANQECPGLESEKAGKSSACEGCPNQQICATAPKGPDQDQLAIAQRLSSVKNIILVLSGKGGVGKSTFSTQMAFSLADKDKEVGLLDIDICGPSVPQMTGLTKQEVHQSNEGWEPIYVADNLGVMSIGFMLPHPDSAIVWRGPRKNGLIKQFLRDVCWGELDYLIIDTPPGTSDEHISVVQLLKDSCMDKTNAIIVTTPQEVALADVRKEINFCQKTNLKILGVVENMSYFATPLLSSKQNKQNLGSQNNTSNKITQYQIEKNGAMELKHGAITDERQEYGTKQNVYGKIEKDFGVRLINQANGLNVTKKIFDIIQREQPGLLENVIVESDFLPSSTGGAQHMCDLMQCKLLGKIPMDQQLTLAGEKGVFLKSLQEAKNEQSLSFKSITSIIEQVLDA